MKTLVITDLDGTLLRSDKTISKESCEILNRLISDGVAFSYATARSIYSASALTRGINLCAPVITKNGTVIVNPANKSNLHENAFTEQEAKEIYQILRNYNLDPIVASYQNGKEKFSYDCTNISKGTQSFLNDHVGDEREHPVEGEGHVLDGSVHYFTCIGTAAEMEGAYAELKKKYRSLCAKDTYSDEVWLKENYRQYV